jgi:hypothetical protein
MPRFTNGEKVAALALRDEGCTWAETARRLGVGTTALRLGCDPEYRERRYAENRERDRRRAAGLTREWAAPPPTPPTVGSPVTLSQFWFGDPVPGRNALDRRGSRP